VLAALDERQDDRGQPGGEEAGAADVEAARALAARLGHDASGECQRHRADRHVDEEAARQPRPATSACTRTPPTSWPPAAALREARGDEDGRAPRHPARRRGRGEQGEAEGEHAPAAVLVAEPAGGDEERRERQAVAGDDPLDRPCARVQVGLHRGHRDVDDEEVQDDHEGAGEDDGQGGPAARPRSREPGGGQGRGCDVVCAHDALDGRSGTEAWRLPAG
jgi:hypothetical protein